MVPLQHRQPEPCWRRIRRIAGHDLRRRFLLVSKGRQWHHEHLKSGRQKRSDQVPDGSRKDLLAGVVSHCGSSSTEGLRLEMSCTMVRRQDGMEEAVATVHAGHYGCFDGCPAARFERRRYRPQVGFLNQTSCERKTFLVGMGGRRRGFWLE